jgi:hypothetical protein
MSGGLLARGFSNRGEGEGDEEYGSIDPTPISSSCQLSRDLKYPPPLPKTSTSISKFSTANPKFPPQDPIYLQFPDFSLFNLDFSKPGCVVK